MSINLAVKQAHKSTFKHQMGAVIVKGARVIAVGHNRINRYSRKVHQKWPGSLHAEQAAILKVLNQPNGLSTLVGAALYVSRTNADGGVMLAKPCKFCMETIKAVGISRVIYTTNEGTTEEIKL